MAYIPPHKRHSSSSDKPKPVPESLVPAFKQTLNLGPKYASQGRSNKNSSPGWGIVYAKHSISRWWPPVAEPEIFSGGGTRKNGRLVTTLLKGWFRPWWPLHAASGFAIPETFRLEPVPGGEIHCRTGENPHVLVGDQHPAEVTEDSQRRTVKEPWVSITERITPLIMATLQNLDDELLSQKEVFRLYLDAKFGKIFFYGDSIDSLRKLAATSEVDSRKQVRKLFYNSLPKEYVEDIQRIIIPKLGLNCFSEKEYYKVKVLDKYLPDSEISCKCVVGEDGKRLQVSKIKLIPVRLFLADTSCLDKDLDFRVLLYSEKILVDLDDEEKDSIDKLINSAVIDKDVKGGLRWPLGKEEVGNRFRVVGAWQVKQTAFEGPTMKLKLRHADRFDFISSTGKDINEVILKMTEICKWLQSGTVEEDQLARNLEGIVKLIWVHLLSCEHAVA